MNQEASPARKAFTRHLHASSSNWILGWTRELPVTGDLGVTSSAPKVRTRWNAVRRVAKNICILSLKSIVPRYYESITGNNGHFLGPSLGGWGELLHLEALQGQYQAIKSPSLVAFPLPLPVTRPVETQGPWGIWVSHSGLC